MSKPYKALRNKMSSVARAKADGKVKLMIKKMMLHNLRKIQYLRKRNNPLDRELEQANKTGECNQ